METLTLGQIEKLSQLIRLITKLPSSKTYELAETMDDRTRRYLWAIFYEKKYDEFRNFIKDYKPVIK